MTRLNPNLELSRRARKMSFYAPISLRQKQAVLRGRGGRSAREEIRHAALRLFAGDAGGSFSKARPRDAAGGSPRLLRDEIQLQPFRAALARESRQRFRHRERRRTASRA